MLGRTLCWFRRQRVFFEIVVVHPLTLGQVPIGQGPDLTVPHDRAQLPIQAIPLP
jgi:hypothetical protein